MAKQVYYTHSPHLILDILRKACRCIRIACKYDNHSICALQTLTEILKREMITYRITFCYNVGLDSAYDVYIDLLPNLACSESMNTLNLVFGFDPDDMTMSEYDDSSEMHKNESLKIISSIVGERTVKQGFHKMRKSADATSEYSKMGEGLTTTTKYNNIGEYLTTSSKYRTFDISNHNLKSNDSDDISNDSFVIKDSEENLDEESYPKEIKMRKTIYQDDSVNESDVPDSVNISKKIGSTGFDLETENAGQKSLTSDKIKKNRKSLLYDKKGHLYINSHSEYPPGTVVFFSKPELDDSMKNYLSEFDYGNLSKGHMCFDKEMVSNNDHLKAKECAGDKRGHLDGEATNNPEKSHLDTDGDLTKCYLGGKDEMDSLEGFQHGKYNVDFKKAMSNTDHMNPFDQKPQAVVKDDNSITQVIEKYTNNLQLYNREISMDFNDQASGSEVTEKNSKNQQASQKGIKIAYSDQSGSSQVTETNLNNQRLLKNGIPTNSSYLSDGSNSRDIGTQNVISRDVSLHSNKELCHFPASKVETDSNKNETKKDYTEHSEYIEFAIKKCDNKATHDGDELGLFLDPAKTLECSESGYASNYKSYLKSQSEYDVSSYQNNKSYIQRKHSYTHDNLSHRQHRIGCDQNYTSNIRDNISPDRDNTSHDQDEVWTDHDFSENRHPNVKSKRPKNIPRHPILETGVNIYFIKSHTEIEPYLRSAQTLFEMARYMNALNNKILWSTLTTTHNIQNKKIYFEPENNDSSDEETQQNDQNEFIYNLQFQIKKFNIDRQDGITLKKDFYRPFLHYSTLFQSLFNDPKLILRARKLKPIHILKRLAFIGVSIKESNENYIITSNLTKQQVSKNFRPTKFYQKTVGHSFSITPFENYIAIMYYLAKNNPIKALMSTDEIFDLQNIAAFHNSIFEIIRNHYYKMKKIKHYKILFINKRNLDNYQKGEIVAQLIWEILCSMIESSDLLLVCDNFKYDDSLLITEIQCKTQQIYRNCFLVTRKELKHIITNLQ